MGTQKNFIANYKPDRLYVNPGNGGAYAAIASETTLEEQRDIGDIQVDSRTKICVSAFYVNKREDWARLVITKQKFDEIEGWQPESEVAVNNFDASKIKLLLGFIRTLDMKDAKKVRLDLNALDIENLTTVLRSDRGSDLIKELANSPELEQDIYAVAAKRQALEEFRVLLEAKTSESDWQNYFERNPWVFGYGLAFVFLNKVSGKLEVPTTGVAFDRSGKRADGLLRTQAAVSQYVLVEIKRANTDLLEAKTYRPGCYGASRELSNAVTQVQKTAFEFCRARFRDTPKDMDGKLLDDEIYSVQPRTYLIIGSQETIKGYEDKVACFELYRRSIRTPEIITFDELYERAACIVQHLSQTSSY